MFFHLMETRHGLSLKIWKFVETLQLRAKLRENEKWLENKKKAKVLKYFSPNSFIILKIFFKLQQIVHRIHIEIRWQTKIPLAQSFRVPPVDVFV